MEEFAFSESLFAAERPRRRNGPDVSGYSAKLCEAQWFESRDVDARCRDDSERLTLHKFRGDAAYRARDYAAALGWYDACLSLVPLSNTAVRRDALEARSRCLSHVGRTDEALQTAHTLGTIATNMDHDCVVHTLVAAIQRQAGHLQGELSALTRLTSLRPLDAWHWRRLAAIYQELSRCARSSVQCNGEQSHSDSDGHSNGGSSCGSGSSHNCDTHRPSDNSDPSTACGFQSCIHSDSHDASTCALPNVGDEAAKRMSENNKCATDVCTKAAAASAGDAESMELMSGSPAVTDEPERWRLYACACRVRARLLLQLSSASQSAFILDRNLEAQANITSDLEKSGVGETTLMCMAEVLGEDLVTLGTTGDESQGTDEARSHDDTPNSIGQFEKRWFGRLYGVAHGGPVATLRASGD
ncbi:uncharacterized protein C8orf76 homolog [Petromyzon marinus]|uniref:uncharacterized protein C8orf76 homolog n=1 Tax=Petromyzon marinus TaxID=7757 RepID=UPI003F70168C